jgi:hypothetical protein
MEKNAVFSRVEVYGPRGQAPPKPERDLHLQGVGLRELAAPRNRAADHSPRLQL